MSDRQMFFLVTDRVRDRAAEAIRSVPDGWVCEVRAKTRTLAQNSRMFAMLTDVSRQVEWYGRKLTPEEWKDVFSAALKKQDAVPGIDGGFVVLGARTSRMTVREIGDLMELMSAFGSERGVQFTEGCEEWPSVA